MVSKTWGFEVPIVNVKGYAAKFLYVLRDRYCSIHRHGEKDETFLVLRGTVRLNRRVLRAGDTVRIAAMTWHRFTGITDATILEISTHDLDDTERRELSVDAPLVSPPANLREFLIEELGIVERREG